MRLWPEACCSSVVVDDLRMLEDGLSLAFRRCRCRPDRPRRPPGIFCQVTRLTSLTGELIMGSRAAGSAALVSWSDSR